MDGQIQKAMWPRMSYNESEYPAFGTRMAVLSSAKEVRRLIYYVSENALTYYLTSLCFIKSVSR